MIQDHPFIIDITEPARQPTDGLADVLIGALGVAGAITLGAVLVGIVVGALMFWARRRAR